LQGLAGQLTWLLPFALIGLLALWRRPASLSAQGLGEVGLSSEKGLTLIAMALWLLPGLAYFSFTTGFWHTYYLATIAPPLAALVGIGAAAMYRHYLAAGAKGWLLVVAVPVTGLVQVMILLYDAEWSGILIPVLLCGTVAATAVLAWARWQKRDEGDGLRKAAALVAIGLLFVAPFVWACTPLLYGDGSTLPTAGPQASRGGPGVGPSNGPPDTGNGLSGLRHT
jgi:4-amino-4-deoxy-L-arabinose transferase-like glycosyltransferase